MVGKCVNSHGGKNEVSNVYREILFIKGEHNASRDFDTINQIIAFIMKNINKKMLVKQNLSKSSKLL